MIDYINTDEERNNEVVVQQIGDNLIDRADKAHDSYYVFEGTGLYRDVTDNEDMTLTDDTVQDTDVLSLYLAARFRRGWATQPGTLPPAGSPHIRPCSKEHRLCRLPRLSQ